ncbi:MAG TPA: hypothetical protein VNV25_20305 [Gemmatimonadaceae bacterium]|jgi:PBP1b-binding outer membrane lipoprotein LpoB|nr:hypothetical protein [Gemmatimonadaceae bacterium]
MVTKRHAVLLLLAAIVAACSSSTSPNGEQSPSNAKQGQKVNLAGTYSLSTFTFDSADGGSWSQSTDANNTATLTLTAGAYTLASTGALTQTLSNTHGSYTATDTSSSSQGGTLVLYDSVAAKTQNYLYSYSNNTLTVSAPNGDGNGNTIVTAWAKQ